MKFPEKLLKALNIIRESALNAEENIPEPSEVIKIIDQSKTNYVIIGAHGIYHHTQKLRATIDIDIVVSDPPKVTKLISDAWPFLIIKNLEAKISFMQDGHEVIDLVKPNQPIFLLALQHHADGLPTLEMALVLKFASMISPNRQMPEKTQDAADFKIMTLKNKDKLCLEKLTELAAKAEIYNGAPKEISELTSNIIDGKPISI